MRLCVCACADVPRLQLHVQCTDAATALESLRRPPVHGSQLRQQCRQPGDLRLHQRLLQEVVHQRLRLSPAAVAASQRHCAATQRHCVGTPTVGTVPTVSAHGDHSVWSAGPLRQDHDRRPPCYRLYLPFWATVSFCQDRILPREQYVFALLKAGLFLETKTIKCRPRRLTL